MKAKSSKVRMEDGAAAVDWGVVLALDAATDAVGEAAVVFLAVIAMFFAVVSPGFLTLNTPCHSATRSPVPRAKTRSQLAGSLGLLLHDSLVLLLLAMTPSSMGNHSTFDFSPKSLDEVSANRFRKTSPSLTRYSAACVSFKGCGNRASLATSCAFASAGVVLGNVPVSVADSGIQISLQTSQLAFTLMGPLMPVRLAVRDSLNITSPW